MQATRRLIDVAAELAARMQHGENDFECRLLRKFGVWIDRNAAAVVADQHRAVLVQLNLDAAGMAGDRLVHGVIKHFGREVVQRMLVGASDIHAWAGVEPAPVPPEPQCLWRNSRSSPSGRDCRTDQAWQRL